MEENREYCKRIAEELEAYAAGRAWKCPECGEVIITAEGGAEAPEHCGAECEALFVSDYLADVLDYEITIDSQLEYKSAKIWVTLGGPNVWIDTAEKAVKLAWGTDRAEYALDWDTCDEIDEYMRELYTCQREV